MNSFVSKIRYAGTRLALAGGSVMAMVAGAKVQFEIDGQPINAVNVSSLTLPQMVNQIISIILIVVGVLAIVYLIYGGIQYVTAGGEAEKATKGRTTITNAIIGIVLIVASYAIFKYISVDAGLL